MQPNDFNSNLSVAQSTTSELATNKVLRNTYCMLGMTLLFSAITAGVAMINHATMPTGFGGLLLFFGGAYGLLFLTQALRNSIWGIASCFAFTGFMGYTLGPLLNAYLATFSNGSEIIMTALGGTGLIFFALSGYILTTKKDFSFMTGFLGIGAIVLMVAVVANLFLQMPILQLTISCLFTLFSSAMILWQTSSIINGGERNYIMATISLYLSIYNLFVSLLSILSSLSGNRE